MGIEKVLSTPRSPWQRAYVERIIGSIRRECLDHVMVFDERSLRRTLACYFDYYHRSRTHLSLDSRPPEISPPPARFLAVESGVARASLEGCSFLPFDVLPCVIAHAWFCEPGSQTQMAFPTGTRDPILVESQHAHMPGMKFSLGTVVRSTYTSLTLDSPRRRKHDNDVPKSTCSLADSHSTLVSICLLFGPVLTIDCVESTPQ
jgi:hypothetical protein